MKKMIVDTRGMGTAYPSREVEYSIAPICSGIHVAQSFVFCVVVCESLFVSFSVFL